jgi:hypothetical protein
MPGRKAHPGQYDEANRHGPLVGGRCSVGEGIPAPHRLTIRLSEAQWQQLNAAALDMRQPLAKAARRLLLEGVGLYWLNPQQPLEALPAKRRKGRPVVAGSAVRQAVR